MMVNFIFCIFMKELTQIKEKEPGEVLGHLRFVLF